MEKVQINISKSLILNLLLSLILSFFTLIVIFQFSDNYIDYNPLSQFGPVYRAEGIGSSYELSNARDVISDFPYPNKFEILLIQIKIIFSGRYDLTISYITFGVYMFLIYAIKYLKIKIV